MSEMISRIDYRFFQAREHLFKTFRPQEYQRRETFTILREAAIAQSQRDTAERIATNPQKTPLEQSLGIYVEELEPQVREAVVRMRELSYSTNESGFIDLKGNQFISGDFTLQKDTQRTLQNMSVSVREYMEFGYPITVIKFRAETPDLEAITQKWNAIAAVLPPSGQPLLDKARWKILADEFLQKEQTKQKNH